MRGFVKAVPSHVTVIGFAGELVKPEGKITLQLTLEDYRGSRKKTVLAEFVVIKATSPYNIIIGRTRLWQFQALASTIHGVIKFPLEHEVVIIQSQPLRPPPARLTTHP